ncbi:branched-chain amino acid ABC transporter permease [Pyrofollis japonicus]|uniref:branched-chain amino acid ABC transporter permease n=1 Tax=Pyrofollis japonicus TaxID=3060460 RepID=UPI00295BBFAB|nr:branched-chain amino acid ABC transporter permease [Pyrofollis japonicus]BEP17975.1 branched-chain amino acid ABC transporter permease [Pyrofollis japonicus]
MEAARIVSELRKGRYITNIIVAAVIVLLLGLGIGSIYSESLAYYRETLTTFMVLLSVVLGLNIILGYTGYVSFGHAVFFGIGGYTAMVLMYYYGVNIYLAMIAAALVAMATAYLVGLIVLRLRGAYFAIATIAVLEASRVIAENINYLGGSEGLQLPATYYRGYHIAGYSGLMAVHYIAYFLLVATITVGLLLNLYVSRSKFGAGLRAIREDEDAAEAIGVDTWKYKTLAYVLSAIPPALAGAVIAWKRMIVLPGEFFNLELSIKAIISVMLGGSGTVTGTLVGAATYHAVETSFLTSFPSFHLIIFGAAIAAIAEFLPMGVIGWLRLRSAKLRFLLE